MIPVELKNLQDNRPRKVSKVVAPKQYKQLKNIDEVRADGVTVGAEISDCRVDVYEFPDGSTGWVYCEEKQENGVTFIRYTAGTDNCSSFSKGWEARPESL